MTATSPSLADPRRAGPRQGSARWLALAWVIAVIASGVFWLAGKAYAPWAFKLPLAWRWNLRYQLSDLANWLLDEAAIGPVRFTDLTRALAWLIDAPYQLALAILSSGLLRGQGSDAVQLLPPLSWLAVIVAVALMGRYARDWKLAALAAACFAYLAVFGQWNSAMVTLASIVIAVPIGVLAGLLLGLAGHRWRWFATAMQPLLDLMQTVPVFAYLVPILVFFGFGPVAAILATIIYATPPMVRITMLALKQVPGEIVDLGRMVGCTRRQMTWKVMIPAATSSLMVGVNQVIMLSLNMVIIASMIGAGGLGFDVLASLRRLDIGAGLEAGAAIVVLAIALDRLSQAFADLDPASRRAAPEASFPARHPYTLTAVAVVLASATAGVFWHALQAWPEPWTLSTGTVSDEVVKYINVNFFDTLEAVKTAVLLKVLIPFKRFLLSLPWPVVIVLLGLAGYSLKGWRLALLCMALALFIVFNGMWAKAMITVYLVAISVVFACLIGMPVAIAAAERSRAWQVVQTIIDTLQTLPSFVYLIPVVMLFRVGDFSAMVAVIAYAVAPAIRYTAHGLRQIDPQLIEAGVVSGCTRWQLLTKIKLKLALPEILLGLNQTVMLAISMLVITALVGTRDLGQEVYIALTKADIGRGLVAGLSIAFIAIITDRLITAGAQRMARRLGVAITG